MIFRADPRDRLPAFRSRSLIRLSSASHLIAGGSVRMVKWGFGRPGVTNLAEDLKLCAICHGGFSLSPRVVPGLGGALAAELVLAERIEVDADVVSVLDDSPTGDQLVDDVLAGLIDRGEATRPSTWIAGVGVGASPYVHASLVAKRLVEGAAKPRLTASGERPPRRLEAVLTGAREPDARTAVLAGLVSVCGLVEGLVPADAGDAAQIRAAGFATGDSVPEPAREPISSVLAAVSRATVGLGSGHATQAA
jgi:hypothetical protein